MRFGFSYVGLIYLIMLMVPNIIWTKNKPADYDSYAKNENRILLMFERTGEVLVSCLVLIFPDLNLRSWTKWESWLVVSFLFMILYELYWLKYFKSEKTMRDQYISFGGFPVAGATLPVIAFFCLGIYGMNILLVIAVIILGVGHIGIHLAHEKEVYENDEKNIVKKILRFKWVILVIIIAGALVIPVWSSGIMRTGVIHFGADAVRYDYDPDNLLGIKATVVDGYDITYIFDKDKCLFNRNDVSRALVNDEIFACFRNIPSVHPKTVIYNKSNNEVYLTFCFEEDDNMERVDGFYLYLSDTEWITVNQPKDITSVDHYEITDHNYHNVGTEAEYESWFGHDWTQVWNKDGSGKWSELRDRHYGRDTMPLE